MPSPRATTCLVLALTLALSGCSGLIGSEQAPSDRETTTAAPVPTTAPASTETQNTTRVTQPRYLSLSPTCERPPGLVIHIQVEALQNNDPETNAGIETVWRFASPSNRQVVGPYEAFVSTIRSRYQPLLTAETITYGPLVRDGDRVMRTVTVQTGNSTTRYRWLVTRQSTTPYEGCWMTSGVIELSADERTAS